ncbi:hypothetical protein NMY22_g13003 [Coprinellus aureogranulatus]|nr:hypothetical protein NMY22_g13003 [Coprinellus aureogranulatus]
MKEGHDCTLSIFAELPEELLEKVLFHQLYSGEEFREEVEYEDRYREPWCVGERHGFPRRQSLFATTIALVNRRFHALATRILWRFVVIRTGAHLRLLNELAEDGGDFAEAGVLAHETRRLELRIRDEYDANDLKRLLERMDNLEVFINRNQPHSTYNAFPVERPPLVGALSGHCSRLIRIQFESGVELPDSHGILDLVQGKPSLKTLRVAQFRSALGTQPVRWVKRNARDPEQELGLQTLSLGSTDAGYWHAVQQMQTTAEAMATSLPAPHLRTLHLMERDGVVVDALLRGYGAQVEELLVMAPWRGWNDDEGIDWGRKCPNVRSLVWYVEGADSR